MAGEQTVVDGVAVDVVDDGTTDDVVDDVSGDTVIDDLSSDDSDDDASDGDSDDDTKKVEPWMSDESQQPLSDVPASTHIRMKQKLKGRLSDKDQEVERLRQENEALKAGTLATTPRPNVIPKRPKENDFDTIIEFEEALGEYDQKMVDIRLATSTRKTQIAQAQSAAKAKLEEAVDGHYSRAAALIQENGIDTEVYKTADLIVREAIETLMPGKGDITTDQIISVLGEGSEKVMYYLGRNKNALNELKSLLIEDKTGLKATLFLGQQRERLLNIKKRTSKAPPPGSTVKGDGTVTSVKASSLLKKRKAAQKDGNLQLAYDIKKQAKAAGVDVSKW